MRRLFLLLLLLFWTGTALAAPIEIRAPGQQTIPLAVTSFLPLEKGGEHPEIAGEVNAVLNSDFQLSGLFRLVDPASFMSDAHRLGLVSVAVDFGQWRLLGAQDLIKGAYSVRGDELVIEARLYDVSGQRLLTGRRYVGKLKNVRRMTHAFADQVLKSLTGKAGPFDCYIAYVGNRTGHKELYLMDVDGHHPIRLTDHRSIVLNPDFSPDGKDVIFTSYKEGNPDLYLKKIYTGQESRISHRPGLNAAGRFSPTGRRIALTLSKDGNSEIYLLGTGGKILQRVTDSWGIDVDPSWSPMGDAIAFVSDRQGNPHIFIKKIGGKSVHRLTRNGKYNATPAWSPNGDRIAFSRLENDHFDIYTVHPDGTGERRLTFGPGNKEHPRWSPDGRFIVYSSDVGGAKAIYIMRADGTGARRISPPGELCMHPAWSPRR